MSLQHWLGYATILFLFAITPGPAVILASAHGASRGFSSGMAVAAGVMVGNMMYFALSAAGLGAIVLSSERVFLTVKYAGAGYLLFIGLRTLIDAWRVSARAEAPPPKLWAHPVWQGVSNQLANPKSILFYSAILPQFVDYRAPYLAAQLLLLAATEWAIELPLLALFIAVAAKAGRLSLGKRSKMPQIASGLALVGVGTSVAWSGDAR